MKNNLTKYTLYIFMIITHISYGAHQFSSNTSNVTQEFKKIQEQQDALQRLLKKNSNLQEYLTLLRQDEQQTSMTMSNIHQSDPVLDALCTVSTMITTYIIRSYVHNLTSMHISSDMTTIAVSNLMQTYVNFLVDPLITVIVHKAIIELKKGAQTNQFLLQWLPNNHVEHISTTQLTKEQLELIQNSLKNNSLS